MNNDNKTSSAFRRETLVITSAWYALIAVLPESPFYALPKMQFAATALSVVWILLRHRQEFFGYVKKVFADRFFDVATTIWLIVLLFGNYIMPVSWIQFIPLAAAIVSIILLTTAAILTESPSVTTPTRNK